MKVLALIASVLLAQFVGQTSAEGTIYPCPPFGLTRLGHSMSCDKFVQCFAGVSVVKTCAAGLHYSTTLEECTSPAEAACYREQDPCPLYNDPTNLIYHQDDADCSKYYLCYENKMHEFSCAEGLHWDTENERCSYPQDAECELYEIDCPATGSANRPHPYICNRYYYCLDGVAFPTECPGNLLFDIETGYCNDPAVATCATGPGATTVGTTSTSTTTTTTTTTTTSTTTTTTEAPWFACPSSDFGVFPHPTNGCQWYVVCENGIPTEGECPLYTYYEDRLAICWSGLCN